MSRMTTERLEELYVGTLALVAEHGYDKLTMDQIAEATRSSKATLYRQWGSKAALVVEALRCTGQIDDEFPDTGTIRGDLEAMARHDKGHDKGDSDLITAIMHAMRTNEELAAAVRTEILGPARGRIATMLRKAVDRGEIAADNPALPFADLLFMSPMLLHIVLEGTEPEAEYLHRYFEGVVLPALGIH
jgi:AcrR family transcriptional regulator